MALRHVVRMLVLLFSTIALAIPAAAQPIAPNWSGLDARFYAGPIPAAGNLIETVELAPELSLTGAGAAYRILYLSLIHI